jgi:RNA polymerase sigma factor (TIGR02999 family)
MMAPATPAPPPQRMSQWLDEARQGRKAAMDALLPLVYAELKRVARAYMRRERPGRTLQPTALVHEAYVRLLQEQHVSWENRAHFCAIAAHSMRQILVEHARARNAAKRGGGVDRITIDERFVAAPAPPVDVEALDEALSRLSATDARRAKVVELKYFGGMTVEEIGEVLQLSPATVKRDWTFARAWLHRELYGDAHQPGR